MQATRRFLALAVCAAALAAPRAPALAADPASILGEIHAAYAARDGVGFQRRLDAELASARSAPAADCARRQAALIELGRARGFDGLESLALAYHDCLASDPRAASSARALVEALGRALAYRAAPLRELPGALARRQQRIEQRVDGQTLRAVLAALVALGPDQASRASLARVLQTATSKVDLFDLEGLTLNVDPAHLIVLLPLVCPSGAPPTTRGELACVGGLLYACTTYECVDPATGRLVKFQFPDGRPNPQCSKAVQMELCGQIPELPGEPRFPLGPGR
jgi:hypothetical protein